MSAFAATLTLQADAGQPLKQPTLGHQAAGSSPGANATSTGFRNAGKGEASLASGNIQRAISMHFRNDIAV
jgi:hypothetical protein